MTMTSGIRSRSPSEILCVSRNLINRPNLKSKDNIKIMAAAFQNARTNPHVSRTAVEEKTGEGGQERVQKDYKESIVDHT